MVLPLLVLILVFLLSKMIFRTPTAEIGGNKVTLEIAASTREAERGLMGRRELPEDQGMLFLFNPPRKVNFYMYHTLISLDMLFMKGGKIARLFENVPPCQAENPNDCPRYGGVEVSEVLELNGGYAQRHHVKEGDCVKLDLRMRCPSIDESIEDAKSTLKAVTRLMFRSIHS